MSSDYTGHVDPRGTAATRELADVTITKLSVGPMDNNAYLVVCKAQAEAVLIDAANDSERLMAVIAADPLRPSVAGIVTTHSHQDHWQALGEVADQTGALIYAGAPDAAALPVPVDVELAHGDTVPFGDCRLQVIALRGHTPGSVALLYTTPDGGNHLFTGDSLFPGGPGKTQTPRTFSSLMGDLESRVFGQLDDATWVYPGHGDDTTLGTERPHLARWRRRGW
jgi:glyoxylase-like metal-dependent hydrolase (beta-lactamase superfamily II)